MSRQVGILNAKSVLMDTKLPSSRQWGDAAPQVGDGQSEERADVQRLMAMLWTPHGQNPDSRCQREYTSDAPSPVGGRGVLCG